MLNFVAEPKLLEPILPVGTELDFHEGETFVSVVGFLFLDTRIMGVPIPLHRNFEEVNLRFYVRRRAPEGWRRGVVFVRELVPDARSPLSRASFTMSPTWQCRCDTQSRRDLKGSRLNTNGGGRTDGKLSR